MKERPILFSAPMVRAILDGRKTQTRREMKPQPVVLTNDQTCRAWLNSGDRRAPSCPYGVPGLLLWVRETHAPAADTWGAWERRMHGDKTGPGPDIFYRADGGDPHIERWRPSIHMPRWASRITLEITDVRVERLQEINPDDVLAEGVTKRPQSSAYPWHVYAKEDYAALWDSISAKRCPWASNPWVWCLSFRKLPAKLEAPRQGSIEKTQAI